MQKLVKRKIEKQDHFGRGIVREKEKVVFVEQALEDEICTLQVIQEKKNYALAKVLQYDKVSPDRTEVTCPYYDRCGGCQLLHQSYEAQLKFKRNKVIELMKKFANIREDKIKLVKPSLPFAYRNKVVFHIEYDRLGFYQEKTKELIPVDDCLLLQEEIKQVIPSLQAYIKDHPGLTDAMIRFGDESKEILLSLKGKAEKESLIAFFHGKVDSLLWNEEVLFGKDEVVIKLFDQKFQVASHSFFQVNRYQTETLYQVVIDWIKKQKPKKVLDLYCGTGTIGLLVSPYVEEVRAVEVVEDAVKNAIKNQSLNHRKNISFHCAKVEEEIASILTDIDFIILDPPRSGLEKRVIEEILQASIPQIVYISCDPTTLARDLKLLQEKYEVIEIQPVDMFPNTFHVECVCVLKIANHYK